MSLTAFHHLVVRVKDIDAGIANWRDNLGMELDRTSENEALGIKQAFFNLPGGGFIEVVAPLNDDSPVGKAVASRGEGVHLISMDVDDLDATIKEYQDRGVQLIGVGGPQVFIHPKSANGIMVGIKEKD